MKVNISVTSIGVFLVLAAIIILTLRGVSVFGILTQSISLKEGFQGDDDLILTTCPADTKSFVDNGGRTICCDGEIHGGVCKGSAICSLSESVGNMPTCGQWLGAYLAEKGKNRCPPSMPNYFESPTGGGCTAGARNSTGTGATEGSAACKLYKTQEEDNNNLDSCTNQKILEETQCFNNSVISSKQLFGLARAPAFVGCEYTDPVTQVPILCIDDKSYLNSMKIHFKDPQEFSSWKDGTNNWHAQTKLGFCSVVQKLNIDKTIQLSDVASLQLFK